MTGGSFCWFAGAGCWFLFLLLLLVASCCSPYLTLVTPRRHHPLIGMALMVPLAMSSSNLGMRLTDRRMDGPTIN